MHGQGARWRPRGEACVWREGRLEGTRHAGAVGARRGKRGCPGLLAHCMPCIMWCANACISTIHSFMLRASQPSGSALHAAIHGRQVALEHEHEHEHDRRRRGRALRGSARAMHHAACDAAGRGTPAACHPLPAPHPPPHTHTPPTPPMAVRRHKEQRIRVMLRSTGVGRLGGGGRGAGGQACEVRGRGSVGKRMAHAPPHEQQRLGDMLHTCAWGRVGCQGPEPCSPAHAAGEVACIEWHATARPLASGGTQCNGPLGPIQPMEQCGAAERSGAKSGRRHRPVLHSEARLHACHACMCACVCAYACACVRVCVK